MKKFLLTTIVCSGLLFQGRLAAQEADSDYLAIIANDSTKVYFPIDDAPTVTIASDTLLCVATSSKSYSAPFSQIAYFKLCKSSEITAIKNIGASQQSLTMSGALVYVSGLDANEKVSIFGVDGKAIAVTSANNSGTATVSLAALPKGVYVIKTRNNNYKLKKYHFKSSDGCYKAARGTVEETVNYMTELLDEAMPYLKWYYDEDLISTYLVRDDYDDIKVKPWTQAAAMALKAKVLLFAASPLFNADAPYYDGTTSAEQNKLVWYGTYDSNGWQKALAACEDFFTALATNGYYELWQASSKTPDKYRQAYRMGYVSENSKEVIHATRVVNVYGLQSTYCWWNWGLNTYDFPNKIR